ncbi:S24 family peptidase [Leeuwenhoekiella nanhaiensis]|nr:hypothetical protein [Leeuwenhoekiella nanhaiensis]
MAKLSWEKAAEGLPVSGPALRIAFSRKSVDEIYLEHLEQLLQIKNEKVSDIKVNEPLTYYENGRGLQYEEMAGGKYLLTVPLVPVRAQATYVSEYTDAEYINDLGKVSFVVDRIGQGNYRAFEVINDSMNDGSINSIPHGTIVLGRELQKHHWTSPLRVKQYPHWIIVHRDTVMCKEIVEHDVERGTITCHSLNDSPEYQDFTINLNDVKELYNIIKRQLD